MPFGTEDEWRVKAVQRMILVKQEKEILNRLSQEEALHSIRLFPAPYILKACPAASRPAAQLDILEYHLAHVKIPWVFRRPI
jgi:hypothetical protein